MFRFALISFVLMNVTNLAFSFEEKIIWGDLSKNSEFSTSKEYQLKLISENESIRRYQQTYKNIPIWGYQMIEHKNDKPAYTGVEISQLNNDIQSIKPHISQENILKSFKLNQLNGKLKSIDIETIIYVDDDKAKLAYLVEYYQFTNRQIKKPTLIIDANSGVILRQFNAMHRQRIGQGPGGNDLDLPHRSGKFQYGNLSNGINQLSKFNVLVKNGRCIMSNGLIRVYSLKNKKINDNAFPYSNADIKKGKLTPFSYPCNKQTGFANIDDGGFAPINSGYSPLNDTMFFAQATIDMYRQLYQVQNPLGKDLPILAFTHIGNLDNAYSIDTYRRKNGSIISHQQIVIGNGKNEFAPLTQTTIPHELTHNFISVNSNLIYDRQSGGINEALADMGDLALREYLSRRFPWYWDHKDWTVGREESLSGHPLRYMDKPSKDGFSIDHASNYSRNLDPHYSSGVYNRAFYLLSKEQGWNIKRAFQVMLDANINYWTPNTNFRMGACGVIQSAKKRRWNANKVIKAFRLVGVRCPARIT